VYSSRYQDIIIESDDGLNLHDKYIHLIKIGIITKDNTLKVLKMEKESSNWQMVPLMLWAILSQQHLWNLCLCMDWWLEG
jgi:hypothetical protein